VRLYPRQNRISWATRAYAPGLFGDFGGNPGGADFLGLALEIFGRVIEEAVLGLGNDLDQGQGLRRIVADHGAGQFHARDVSLQQGQIVLLEDQGQGRLQRFRGSDHRHADAGAAARGLDDQGQADLRDPGRGIRGFSGPDGPVGRNPEARIPIQPLGRQLVHGQGAAEHAGALIGDVQQIEQPLHGPVFAAKGPCMMTRAASISPASATRRGRSVLGS
jgi:hypothetical protein